MPDRGSGATDEFLPRIRGSLDDSARVTRDTLAASGEAIAGAARLLIEAFRGGYKLLAFGNGGSAADAQHLASELAGRFDSERPALPAMALTTNGSDLTAIGNDYGFDRVFARLVEAHGRPGDVAVAISTSGNSQNVIAGAVEARKRGMSTVALTGKGGGELVSLVDVAVIVPSDVTARIQESHIAVCHVLCELIESELFPETAAT
jgi:D-sedoheptulose 7-phosphate isomerase